MVEGKQKSFSNNNQVELIPNGPKIIDLSEKIILEAKEKILFHMYDFEEDEVTKPVVDALIKKANEGVRVFVLMDAFASSELSNRLKAKFESANIKYNYFSPIFSKRFEHFGRRLHQKVLVIDNDKVITGGINYAKKYIAPENDKPWLDYSVLLQGEEVYRLQRKVISLYIKYFPRDRSFLTDSISKSQLSFEKSLPARTVVNDFMRFRTEIHRSYFKAIREAKESVKITATYFHPGKRFLKELKKASKRGVKVELVFGERSDHFWERWSSRYLYSWYLSQGFEIYEWKESIIHAKTAVIDSYWSTVGSYNHNYLSRYACLELNVEIKDGEFAQLIDAEFEEIKRRSNRITGDEWKKRADWIMSSLYFTTYALSNIITFISMLFIVRRREKIDSA